MNTENREFPTFNHLKNNSKKHNRFEFYYLNIVQEIQRNDEPKLYVNRKNAALKL